MTDKARAGGLHAIPNLCRETDVEAWPTMVSLFHLNRQRAAEHSCWSCGSKPARCLPRPLVSSTASRIGFVVLGLPQRVPFSAQLPALTAVDSLPLPRHPPHTCSVPVLATSSTTKCTGARRIILPHVNPRVLDVTYIT